MKKWLNDLITRILLAVLAAWTLGMGISFETVVAGDALSTSSMTAPADGSDFLCMLLVYATLIGVMIFCGVWGKSILANVAAFLYAWLWAYLWQYRAEYQPFLDSWEGMIYLLCNVAHLIIFVVSLIGFVISVRWFYLSVRQRRAEKSGII